MMGLKGGFLNTLQPYELLEPEKQLIMSKLLLTTGFFDKIRQIKSNIELINKQIEVDEKDKIYTKNILEYIKEIKEKRISDNDIYAYIKYYNDNDYKVFTLTEEQILQSKHDTDKFRLINKNKYFHDIYLLKSFISQFNLRSEHQIPLLAEINNPDKFKNQIKNKLEEINKIYDKINDFIKISCFNNDDLLLCESIKKNKPKDIIEYIGRTFGYFEHEEKLKKCGITNYVILQQFNNPVRYYVVSTDAQPKCKIDDSTLRYFKLNDNMSLTEINKETINVDNIICLKQNQKLHFWGTDKYELSKGKMLKSNFISLINTIKKNITKDNITREQLNITPIEKLLDILYQKINDEYQADVIRKYNNIVLFLVHINAIHILYSYLEYESFEISSDIFIDIKAYISYSYNYYTYLSQLASIHDKDKNIDKINEYLYKSKDKIFEEFMEQFINLYNILNEIKQQCDGNFKLCHYILSNFLDKLFKSSKLPIPINKQITIEILTGYAAIIFQKTTEEVEVNYINSHYYNGDRVFNFTPEFEISPYENVKFETYKFPNCGENTLFFLINYLITHRFNDGAFNFDPDFKSNPSFQKLKKLNGDESKLYKFYNKFKDYNNLISIYEITQDIKDEFASIFQKITSEENVYKQGNVCEINPSEQNLIKILNTVLEQNFSNMIEFIKYFYEKEHEKHSVTYDRVGGIYIIDEKYKLEMNFAHASIESLYSAIPYDKLFNILYNDSLLTFSYEHRLLLYGKIMNDSGKSIFDIIGDGIIRNLYNNTMTEDDFISIINNININYIESTGLIYSSFRFTKILEKLFENTKNIANIDKQFERKGPPLYETLLLGLIDAAKILIDKGANVNVQYDMGHGLQFTPLTIIIKRLERPILFDTPENIQNVHNIFKLLIERGADINKQDNYGYTPLIISIIKNNKDITQILLDRGVDINKPDNDGNTPLIISINTNNKDITQILLDKGADINKPANNGNTPLMISINANNKDITQILLERGVDINKPDNYGYTPLIISIINNNDEITNLLLKNKADINKPDNDGNTPLMISINTNNKDITNLLLKNKADINARDIDGNTPLNIAIMNKNSQIALELLKLDTDFKIKNNKGKSALDLAKTYKLPKVVNALFPLMRGGIYIDYKEKYLKYKQKYLELKKYHKI